MRLGHSFVKISKVMVHEELIQQQGSTREQTELILPGINKVWVRSRNGGWCVKGSEDRPTFKTHDDESAVEGTPKKWWKFW